MKYKGCWQTLEDDKNRMDRFFSKMLLIGFLNTGSNKIRPNEEI